ncbi:MAG: arylsulfatase [Bryobacterales bacterium]|nr:arylsulfatase [Bryobacterales bacterium]
MQVSRRQILASGLAALQQRAPNVLLILADDLGSADTGFAGGGIPTPNIDRIALEGARLANFYCTPLCTPTRASLLTGRNPVRYGLIYSVIRPWSPYGLPAGEHTMAESFRDAGYRTAIVGKWHLGHTNRRFLPNARGFHHFYGHVNAEIDYFTHTKLDGLDWQRNGKGVREEGYATDLLGAEAVRWLESRDRARPFFLYLPFNAVHSPMQAPEPLLAKYNAIGNRNRRAYAAMLDAMDTAIGRVLASLEADGSLSNTIVVFLSDNGGALGQGARNGPLRAGKLTVYEGGVRACAAIRWPAHLPPGTSFTQRMSVLDLFPTLCAAAGVKPGNRLPLDGRNLWPALTRGAAAPETSLFWAAKRNETQDKQHAVLLGDWKLVESVSDDRKTTLELFHLVEDPAEKNNVASANQDVVARLRHELDGWKNLHPRADIDSSMIPHPGWSAPADYATVAMDYEPAR